MMQCIPKSSTTFCLHHSSSTGTSQNGIEIMTTFEIMTTSVLSPSLVVWLQTDIEASQDQDRMLYIGMSRTGVDQFLEVAMVKEDLCETLTITVYVKLV